MKKNHITAAVCLAAALAVTVVTGLNFASLKDLGEIKPGDGVTGTKLLSEYFDGIKGSSMDTEVYILEGEKPGGKVLILGGTHGNEPQAIWLPSHLSKMQRWRREPSMSFPIQTGAG